MCVPEVRVEPEMPRRKSLLLKASVKRIMILMEGCYDSMRPQHEDSSTTPPHLRLTAPRSGFPRQRLLRLMSFDDVDCHEDGKMGRVDPITGIKTMLSIKAARAVGGGTLPFSDGCHEVSRECVEATLREVALSRALDAGGESPLSRRRASIIMPPALEAKGPSSHRRRHSSEMVITLQPSTLKPQP